MIAFSSKACTRALLFMLGAAASLGQAPFSMWIISIGALFALYFIQLDATEVEIGPFQRGWIFGFDPDRYRFAIRFGYCPSSDI